MLSLTAKGMPQSGRAGSMRAERLGLGDQPVARHEMEEDAGVASRLDPPIGLRDDRLRPQPLGIGGAQRGDRERQPLDHSRPGRPPLIPASIAAKIAACRALSSTAKNSQVPLHYMQR